MVFTVSLVESMKNTHAHLIPCFALDNNQKKCQKDPKQIDLSITIICKYTCLKEGGCKLIGKKLPMIK